MKSKKWTILLAVFFVMCSMYNASADESIFYGQNDHGVGGTIRVAVTMDGEKIVKIKTVEQQETRGLGTNAILQLTKEIVEKNSLDVDTVAGATLSSIAFVGAVRQAIEEATAYDPIAGITLGENEYLGISLNGLGGRLIVKVTIDGDKITAIDVLEAHESSEIGDVALKNQIAKMIDSNGCEVDSITGATITCDALSEAVTEALNAYKAAHTK